MFKATRMNSRSKKSGQKGLTGEQLIDFSLAEFSSAIEMLQAAKLVKDKKLARGFINHALDEYKHTNFFLTLISRATNLSVKFDPRQAVSSGFLRTEKFLFEKLNLTEFSSFVAVNEANALNIFTSLRPEIALMDNGMVTEIDAIIAEEREHLEAFLDDASRSKKISNAELYNELLSDEARHVAFSTGFLNKRVSNRKQKYLKARQWLATRFRHFWASQEKIRNFIDVFISSIVIFFILPLRSVLRLPKSEQKNPYALRHARVML